MPRQRLVLGIAGIGLALLGIPNFLVAITQLREQGVPSHQPPVIMAATALAAFWRFGWPPGERTENSPQRSDLIRR